MGFPPEHERAIDAARQQIGELFTPKESVVLDFHTRSLGFTDDGKLLPVYLVFEEPFPGSVTQRDDSGRGVCFVSVHGTSGTLLVETMVHELTHAFDVADQGESVLAKLRKLLEAKGVTPRDREYRDDYTFRLTVADDREIPAAGRAAKQRAELAPGGAVSTMRARQNTF